MHVAVWLHWFMAAFFTLSGVWFVAKRARFGPCNPFCVGDGAGDDASERRLAAAFERRTSRGRDFGEAPGFVLGGLSFVLAALAALTGVSVATLYAVFVVGLAVVIAVATGLLRRSHRRAASLAVRERDDAIPTPVFLLVLVSAFVPLVWIATAPGPPIAVTFAGLAIVAIGVRLASRPAELEGDDVRVEAFVDRHVRVARAAGMFSLAPAPAFVFASFSGWTDTAARIVALALAFAACAVGGWRLRVASRKPTAAELARWLHAAP